MEENIFYFAIAITIFKLGIWYEEEVLRIERLNQYVYQYQYDDPDCTEIEKGFLYETSIHILHLFGFSNLLRDL